MAMIYSLKVYNTQSSENQAVVNTKVLGTEGLVCECGEEGSRSTDTEINDTNPDKEHPLSSVFRQTESENENHENQKHEAHCNSITEFIVLFVNTGNQQYDPSPERTKETIADGRNRSHHDQEEIVGDECGTEKLVGYCL